MKKQKAYSLIAFLATAAAIFFLLQADIVRADDDCRGHSCNDGGDVDIDVGGTDVNVPVDVNTDVTGGPVSVEHKSESLGIGLSNSLGDGPDRP